MIESPIVLAHNFAESQGDALCFGFANSNHSCHMWRFDETYPFTDGTIVSPFTKMKSSDFISEAHGWVDVLCVAVNDVNPALLHCTHMSSMQFLFLDYYGLPRTQKGRVDLGLERF